MRRSRFIKGGKVINGSSQYSGELSYIAEAFGISRKHQEEMRRDRGESAILWSDGHDRNRNRGSGKDSNNGQ